MVQVLDIYSMLVFMRQFKTLAGCRQVHTLRQIWPDQAIQAGKQIPRVKISRYCCTSCSSCSGEWLIRFSVARRLKKK